MAMSTYYVHKEPVFGKKRSLFGNEFLFRKHPSSGNGMGWQALSVDEDVVGALSSEGGFESLVGSKPAFISLDVAAVKGHTLAFLPRDSVFQVPEKDALDKEVVLSSVTLKKEGYQIAVDYTPSGRGLLPLHRIADFVRINASSFSADQLSLFKGLRAKLVAASVEDEESFARFRDLGFELFQGPFFVKSCGNGSHSISSSQQVLLRLYNDLRADQDVGVLERTFKNNPKLAYGLLQLMNSAFFRVGPKVASIGHAITLLGYDNLEKWVVLLLFAVDRDAQSQPLVEKALTRSRLMESLALKAGEKALSDSAFITGMLSFMNVFFNMRPDEVTEKLNLVREIQDALTEREGVLGMLLTLAEKADRQEYDGMGEEAEALELSVEDVLRAETNAIMDWRVLENPLNIRLAL
jgi:EAL and modified HD-GYP domain-containing signal transduction protein